MAGRHFFTVQNCIRRLSLYNGEEAKNMPEGQIGRPANLDKWRREIGSV